MVVTYGNIWQRSHHPNNNNNLYRKDATEEDFGVGSQPARTLRNFVQQVPCHLFSRLCDMQASLNWLILWMNV